MRAGESYADVVAALVSRGVAAEDADRLVNGAQQSVQRASNTSWLANVLAGLVLGGPGMFFIAVGLLTMISGEFSAKGSGPWRGLPAYTFGAAAVIAGIGWFRVMYLIVKGRVAEVREDPVVLTIGALVIAGLVLTMFAVAITF